MTTDLTITVGQATPLAFAGTALEDACLNCDATGYRATTVYHKKAGFHPEFTSCDVCGGKGVLLTVEGRRLLDFIKLHSRESA